MSRLRKASPFGGDGSQQVRILILVTQTCFTIDSQKEKSCVLKLARLFPLQLLQWEQSAPRLSRPIQVNTEPALVNTGPAKVCRPSVRRCLPPLSIRCLPPSSIRRHPPP